MPLTSYYLKALILLFFTISLYCWNVIGLGQRYFGTICPEFGTLSAPSDLSKADTANVMNQRRLFSELLLCLAPLWLLQTSASTQFRSEYRFGLLVYCYHAYSLVLNTSLMMKTEMNWSHHLIPPIWEFREFDFLFSGSRLLTHEIWPGKSSGLRGASKTKPVLTRLMYTAEKERLCSFCLVHCCTMSLSGIWVPRQMIITEIRIAMTEIIW